MAACMVIQTSASQTIKQKIDSLIAETPFLQTSEVGIIVYDLNQQKEVYSHQAQKLYRPASIEKVITSVTALAVLGTDYTMNTALMYTGEIADSTLHGDLYVIGGFDPEFMESDMTQLSNAVSDAGIKHIEGRILADVSMMDSIYWGPGWSWDDTPESFQPYYSPLMLNRGCVGVTVSPQQQGQPGVVKVSPASDHYVIENHSQTSTPRAGGLEITRQWLTNSNKILVSGNVVRKSGRMVNMFNPKEFFMHTFRFQLRDQGISLQNDTIYYDAVPQLGQDSLQAEPVLLAQVRRPVGQVLKRALKESDNLSAESLFFHAAKKILSQGKMLTSSDAQEAIDLFMKRKIGANPNDYEIMDGSGVSLYNYISPWLMLQYLKYAYHNRDFFPVFFDALPVAGVDGTLKYRMYKTPAFRRIHAKTGTVSGISSLAGYAMRKDGTKYAFVIINQNILKSRSARSFQDKICSILTE